MLVLSDVCHTLINLNSTYDYIKYLYHHNYWNKKIWFLLKNRLFKIMSYVVYKITWFDYNRYITPRFFKGIYTKDLENINKNFWEFYISKKTKILDKIIKHKESWDDVFLVSASINPPIEILWNYLWLNYYSSQLEEKKWIYTWKMDEDLLWKKEKLIETKLLDIEKQDNVVFYTDNYSDIWFIKIIQKKSKNSKFYLILKKKSWEKKRIKLLSSNGITKYEFVS